MKKIILSIAMLFLTFTLSSCNEVENKLPTKTSEPTKDVIEPSADGDVPTKSETENKLFIDYYILRAENILQLGGLLCPVLNDGSIKDVLQIPTPTEAGGYNNYYKIDSNKTTYYINNMDTKISTLDYCVLNLIVGDVDNVFFVKKNEILPQPIINKMNVYKDVLGWYNTNLDNYKTKICDSDLEFIANLNDGKSILLIKNEMKYDVHTFLVNQDYTPKFEIKPGYKFKGYQVNDSMMNTFFSTKDEIIIANPVYEKYTDNTPIEITTVDEFLYMGRNSSASYKLMNDLDFLGAQLDDMFTSSNPFVGKFEGNGHKISNFKIKSASNAGIFGQADGATIQNLTIENPIIPWENGRSSTNAAVLVGRAINTTIKNINIINAKINVSANSSADINLGVLVGLAESSSISNVKIVNSNIELYRSRLNMSCGLAFGKLKGNVNEGAFVENVYVEGKIKANCYYNNSEGFSYIGGFVGNLGALGLIKNCASLVDITITKEVNSQYTDDFSLAVGGFVGINAEGQMNITNCAAISDINVYSGKLPPEGTENESLNEVQMSKQPIYIGGFIGRAKALFMQIKDCNAIQKTEGAGIKIYAKTDNQGTKMVYAGAFVGDTDLEANIKNCDGLNLELFDEVIKKMINGKALVI